MVPVPWSSIGVWASAIGVRIVVVGSRRIPVVVDRKVRSSVARMRIRHVSASVWNRVRRVGIRRSELVRIYFSEARPEHYHRTRTPLLATEIYVLQGEHKTYTELLSPLSFSSGLAEGWLSFVLWNEILSGKRLGRFVLLSFRGATTDDSLSVLLSSLHGNPLSPPCYIGF